MNENEHAALMATLRAAHQSVEAAMRMVEQYRRVEQPRTDASDLPPTMGRETETG